MLIGGIPQEDLTVVLFMYLTSNDLGECEIKAWRFNILLDFYLSEQREDFKYFNISFLSRLSFSQHLYFLHE